MTDIPDTDSEKVKRRRFMGSRETISVKYRYYFSQGERAVLSSIYDARRKGVVCSHKELGNDAGVGVTTCAK